MEQIRFANGMREYQVNGGEILRFHPGDPNVYARFFEAAEKINGLVQKLAEPEAEEQEMTGQEAVRILRKTDLEIKKILSWAFGGNNDFERIFDGMNLLTVAENGEQIITNFLKALEPILTEGAGQCAREQTLAARRGAQIRRTGHE